MAENPRIEELRRRVLADPASIVFAALAEEFRRVGRYDDAVETCRTGLQRHPAYLSARVTLGRALIELGDFEGAREQLETVLRSAPENLAAIRGLATINERLGHSGEMDPHLADMMTTHAESIRVALRTPAPIPVTEQPAAVPEPQSELSLALPPPAESAPDLPLAPEPELDAASAPPPDPELSLDRPFEADLSWAPQLDSAISTAPQSDSAFSMAPQPDSAFSMSPQPDPAPSTSSPPEAGPQAEAPVDVFASFAAASTPVRADEFSFDLAPTPRPAAPRPGDGGVPLLAEPTLDAPQRQPIRVSQMAPDPADPDPQIAATLARLERFLGAINSLRA